MQKIQIKNNKCCTDLFLEDGEYLIKAISIRQDKNLKEWQKYYFACIDEFANATGNTRYAIHDKFKEYAAIDSTKNIKLDDWAEIIERLNYWLFDKYSN